MTRLDDPAYQKLLRQAFRMPQAQSTVSRKSSITNAFVTSLLPVRKPTLEEIHRVLTILAMTPDDVRCAYCGNRSTEWDHLRPLVLDRRPTGYISEIANLVPACNKCNQSKGNADWCQWMLSAAPHSPTARGCPDVALRVQRLEAFVRWKQPTRIDFSTHVDPQRLKEYWALCERVNEDLRHAKELANSVKTKVANDLSI